MWVCDVPLSHWPVRPHSLSQRPQSCRRRPFTSFLQVACTPRLDSLPGPALPDSLACCCHWVPRCWIGVMARVLQVMRSLALDLELHRGDRKEPYYCLPVCHPSSRPGGALSGGRMEVALPNHPITAINELSNARRGAMHLPKCLDRHLGGVCIARSSIRDDPARQSSTHVGLDGVPGGKCRLFGECAWCV